MIWPVWSCKIWVFILIKWPRQGLGHLWQNASIHPSKYT
jgi:hypothetical protein